MQKQFDPYTNSWIPLTMEDSFVEDEVDYLQYGNYHNHQFYSYTLENP